MKLGHVRRELVPVESLDTWFMTENIRWGRFAPDFNVKALVDKTNRSDLWSEAAKALGVSGAPTATPAASKPSSTGWKFDPADPAPTSNPSRSAAAV